MQELNNGNYSSVADFIHAAVNDLRNPDNKKPRDDHSGNGDHGGGKSWYGAGCTTGKQVRDLISTGWNEGRKRMSKLIDSLDTSALVPVDRKRRLTRCEMGDHLDISAVYRGQFQTAWTAAKRRTNRGPQKIDILANMICSGGEDSDVLFWRGAAAVAFCDKMEQAGYMCRLVVGFGNSHEPANKPGSGSVSCRITVKDYGMPLDISTASAVILPGFFRGLGHGWIAGHNKEKMWSPGISVGRSKVEEGEIFLSHDVRDERTAMAWLAKQVDAINAQVTGEAA